MHISTPLVPSRSLEVHVGVPVHLKLENLQPSGSFKLRGIARLAANAFAAGARSFVSSSGGNAGLAAAYVARRLGAPATVVVPASTDPRIRALIQDEGAKVITHGTAWAEADVLARQIGEREGATYVPPFDHPDIWAGISTMIEELPADMEPPGAVVLSVGGGGLLAGVLDGLRARGWNTTFVVAVETEGAASFAGAQRAGHPVTLPRIDTIARNLGAPRIADGAFERAARWDVRSVLVDDRAALSACRRFLDDHRMLVEPACGATLAAIYDHTPALATAVSVLAIVCGGACITARDLYAVDG